MERDEQGRLLKGHSGLKPKGATGLVTSEIREHLADFIAGKLDSLPDLYESLKPADRMRFIVSIMQMVLPKPQSIPVNQQGIEVKWNEPNPIQITIVETDGNTRTRTIGNGN
jgi:hypothetical protein